MLWTEKYYPKKISDLLIPDEEINKIYDWKEEIDKGCNKPLLFVGPTGTGKTCTANVILNNLDYMVKEINSNDICGQKSVKDIFTKVINYKNVSDMLIFAKKITGIIIDEINTITTKTGEKNVIIDIINMITPEEEVIKVIKDADITQTKKIKINNPVICISDETSDKKITLLKKSCVEIDFGRAVHDKTKVFKFITRICYNEKLKLSKKMKETLIVNTEGDIRKMIIIMQDLYNLSMNRKITEDLVNNLSAKEVNGQIREATLDIINADDDVEMCVMNYNYSKFLMPFMMHENYINAIVVKDETDEQKIESICKCADSIAKADILQNYIYEFQCWDDVGDYTGVYTCYVPNRLINKYDAETKYKSVNYTALSHRVSYFSTNMKNVKEIRAKHNLNLDEIYMLSELLIHHLVNKRVNNKNLVYDIMDQNGIEKMKEIDMLMRINKYNKVDMKKTFTARFKKTIDDRE